MVKELVSAPSMTILLEGAPIPYSTVYPLTRTSFDEPGGSHQRVADVEVVLTRTDSGASGTRYSEFGCFSVPQLRPAATGSPKKSDLSKNRVAATIHVYLGGPLEIALPRWPASEVSGNFRQAPGFNCH